MTRKYILTSTISLLALFETGAAQFGTPPFGTSYGAAMLRGSDSAKSHLYGDSVSIFGNRALVGAPGRKAAYWFTNLDSAEGIVQENAKIQDTQSGVYGFAVSASAVGALVMDFKYGFDWQGRAYFYDHASLAANPPVPKLVLMATRPPGPPPANGENFGFSGSLSGDTALIGAPEGNSENGAAYLYRNLANGTGQKTENLTLHASDGVRGDFFGASASLSGTDALVGASFRSLPGGSAQGAAYLYRNLAGNGTVVENAKLTASDRTTLGVFGSSVSLHGEIGLVGAERSSGVYVFRGLGTAVGTISQDAKLSSSDAPTAVGFGKSVSLYGENGLVGGFSASTGGRGSVYVFCGLDEADGTPANPTTETVVIRPTFRETNDEFGTSVSLHEDRFLIGSRLNKGTAFSGTISALTTLDKGSAERFIDHISFISRTDWVIGATTSDNWITLEGLNSAEVMGSGAVVSVGRDVGADGNRLVLAGKLQTARVDIGSLVGNENNALELKNVADFSGVGAFRLARRNALIASGNRVTSAALMAYLGSTQLQVYKGGSWQVVNAGNVEDLVDRIFAAGRTIITPRVVVGYAGWVEQYFPTGDPRSGPLADPDGDGFSNIFEYMFDTGPNDRSVKPTLAVSNVSGQLLLVMNLRDREDLNWDVQATKDLKNWQTHPPEAAAVREDFPDGTSQMQFRFPINSDTGFVRIRVRPPLPE